MSPMDGNELERWFSSMRKTLESVYLSHNEPWKQSGFSGTSEGWIACRRPIADCIDSSGTFLDIGCANGYLLECLLAWTHERGINVEPWGLDLSERLVALAKRRLPEYASHFFVGNALTWEPPCRFDYVRTELCYVPQTLISQYASRLINEYLAPDGRLLVAEYRSRRGSEGPWVDEVLEASGFKVSSCASGLWKGKELTRVAILPKEMQVAEN